MLDSSNIDNENYIIFASDINDSDTEIALQEMEVNYKKLQGRYKGQDETSFIVNKTQYPLCKMLTRKQESILQLGMVQDSGMRIAGLHYANGNYIPLGNFKEVNKQDALNMDAFTYDPSTQKYFITE